MKCTIRLKGGAGSGFFGHSGRLGFIGGSMAPDKGFGGGGGDAPTKRIRAKLILPQEAFDRLLDASPADIRYAAKHRDIDTMKTLLASANLSSDKRKANAELLRSLIGETSQPIKPAAVTTSPSLLDVTDKFNAAKAASVAANDNVQRVREQFGAGSAEERAARDALQTANIKYNDARADLIEAGGNPKTVKPTIIEQPKASDYSSMSFDDAYTSIFDDTDAGKKLPWVRESPDRAVITIPDGRVSLVKRVQQRVTGKDVAGTVNQQRFDHIIEIIASKVDPKKDSGYSRWNAHTLYKKVSKTYAIDDATKANIEKKFISFMSHV